METIQEKTNFSIRDDLRKTLLEQLSLSVIAKYSRKM
jgi:hypothetical protein